MFYKRAISLMVIICMLAAAFGLGGCDKAKQNSAETTDAQSTAESTTTSQTSASTAGPTKSRDTTQTSAVTTTQSSVATTQSIAATTQTSAATTTQTSTSAASQASTSAASQAGSAAADSPGAVPRASLRMTRGEYPRVDGSTATIPLAIMLSRAVTGIGQEEAEAMAKHTKTSTSFFQLAQGGADLLLVYSPQESLFDELKTYYGISKRDLIIEPIGRDALIFLVNEQNPVKSLTHEQLLDIYTGKATDWSEFTAPGADASAIAGKIVAFQRVKSSGSQVMMENLVMQGVKMAEAPTDRIATEMGELIENVAEFNNSGNAIGYSVYYYFNSMYSLEGVRAMEVGGVPCVNKTIRDGSYPFVQDFYAIIRRDEPAGSAARKLFNFITHAEGQALIDAAGYVSIKGGGDAADSAGSRPGRGETAGADDLAKLKRAGGKPLLSGTAERNVFPISSGGKTGFVNGDGELALEPVYDSARLLGMYDGSEPIYVSGGNNYPLHYIATIYERDENGVPDRDKPVVSHIVGPSGRIIYENRNADIGIYMINIEDGSLYGYRNDDKGYRQHLVFGGGREYLSEDQEAYLTCEIYGGDRRILTNRNNEAFLTDTFGVRLTDNSYGEFYGYTNGFFLFRKNDILIAIDKNGSLIRDFPEDVINLHWDSASGLYTYGGMTAPDKGKPGEWMHGLMDRDFNKVTGTDWHYIYPALGGNAFIASRYISTDPWITLVTLVDKSGKRLTEQDYDYISNSMDGYYGSMGTYADKGYFQARRANADGAEPEYVYDIIDDKGRILFTGTEALSLEMLYGEYAILRVKGNDGTDGKVGLKRVTGGGGLSNPGGGWLARPAYDYIWPENGGYLKLGVQTAEPPDGGNTAIFDVIQNKIIFTGNFTTLNFHGFRDADNSGGKGNRRSVFYAETATRRGYVNERGEWIVSLSNFDSLSADD